jgi:glutathione S-transferase
MNLHLYFCPGTCSFVAHTALELVKESSGQDYQSTLINLRNGDHLKPEFKAINPRMQVPALQVNGKLLTQLIAIIEYIDASFPKAKILPKDTFEKAQALSTLAWMNNTVHPAFTRIFRPERFGGENAKEDVKTIALENFKSHLAEIDSMTVSKEYICGNTLTPADIYAIAFIRWAGMAGIDPSQFKNYQKYVQKLVQNPVVKRIMDKEKINLDTYQAH